MTSHGDLSMKALDFHVQLLKFHLSSAGLDYTSSLAKQSNVMNPKALAGMAGFALNVSDTYAVTDEIGDLIEAGAATIPKYELHAEDVPTRGGLVILETPRVMLDQGGKPLAVKAMLWFTSRAGLTRDDLAAIDNGDGSLAVPSAVSFSFVDPKGGREFFGEKLPGADPDEETRFAITVFLFTDPDDDRDHMYAEHQDYKKEARLNPTGLALVRAPALAMFCGGWLEGQVADFDTTKFMAAFFRFVSSEYVEHRAILPPRAAVKRAKRSGWKHAPEVRLVRLRKEFKRKVLGDRPDGDGDRTIHVQFPVRGHWRMQWYPSQNRHAPKWIAGYWKGDDTMPLAGTDRVFQVDR